MKWWTVCCWLVKSLSCCIFLLIGVIVRSLHSQGARSEWVCSHPLSGWHLTFSHPRHRVSYAATRHVNGRSIQVGHPCFASTFLNNFCHRFSCNKHGGVVFSYATLKYAELVERYGFDLLNWTSNCVH